MCSYVATYKSVWVAMGVAKISKGGILYLVKGRS